MINQLLNTMYHLNIQIKEINNSTKLIYKPGQLDEFLKERIKLHKKEILKTLEENEAAKKAGFLVYQHGALYEYRYGLGAYLFMERHENGLVTAWRANYSSDKKEPLKMKIIAENVPFEKALESALGFIIWLKKRNKEAG